MVYKEQTPSIKIDDRQILLRAIRALIAARGTTTAGHSSTLLKDEEGYLMVNVNHGAVSVEEVLP
jgi:hypothetical protein